MINNTSKNLKAKDQSNLTTIINHQNNLQKHSLLSFRMRLVKAKTIS